MIKERRIDRQEHKETWRKHKGRQSDSGKGGERRFQTASQRELTQCDTETQKLTLEKVVSVMCHFQRQGISSKSRQYGLIQRNSYIVI